MTNPDIVVGDCRVAKMIGTLDEERKRREKEMLNARVILINMKRKHYSLDTEQARWLKRKAGLAT